MPKPQGDSATDRLNLFLAIVPFVLARGESTVDEIATHFGVSPARVIEAVKAIACNGGPREARFNFDEELFNIDWEIWEQGRVSLVVAERLRTPAPLTNKQRAMMLAGLQLLTAHPAYRRLPGLQPLVDKLRASTDGDVVERFAFEVGPEKPFSEELNDAIERGVRVTFTYTNNKGERADRTVEPYRFVVDDNRLYVSGWCLTAGGLRTFNLDSIEDLAVTEDVIEDRSIDVRDLSGSLFERHDTDLEVTVSIDSAAAPLIAPYRQPGDVPDKSGDRESVVLPFAHTSSAIRMISVLSGVAHIVEPSTVRSEVRDFARAALAAYDASA